MEKLTEIILQNLEMKKTSGIAEITYEDVRKKMALLNNIVFEVTEACNLDCYYCTYGKLYKVRENGGKSRKRGKKMSHDTMKKTFDFFAGHWKQEPYGNILNIGFYGGEPLANMDLIKETVQFTRKRFPSTKSNFRLTTNGLLLDEFVDYFVENDFKIMVSLDGNKSQNSYRVTHDGINPFKKITKTLDLIFLKYSDYFQKNVAINSVLHNKNEPSAIIDFFVKKYNKVPFLSKLAETDVNEDERVNFIKLNTCKDFIEEIEKFEINEKFIQSKWGRSILSYLKMIELRYNNFSELIYTTSVNKLKTGSCFPFDRIFVLTDGTLLPCERANHNNCLGNINQVESIDIKKIVKKYNSCLKTLANSICIKCAGRNSCQTCIFEIGKVNSGELVNCDKIVTHSQLITNLDHVSDFISANPTVISRMNNILMNEKDEV